MNPIDLIKTIGSGIISAHPVGAAAIQIVNQFLPDDQKLSNTTTGQQALQVIEQLSGTEKAQIQLSQIDLQKVSLETDAQKYAAMCSADGQQTRANIVNKSMNCLIAVTLIFMCAIAYVYAVDGAKLAFSYEMMAVFASVVAPFAYVVRAYFGDLRSETESRHASINKLLPSGKGITGFIQAIRAK